VNLDELLHEFHLIEDELRTYERKYNVLSETFYEAYQNGEEPPDDAWVLEWTAWASAYKLLLRRRRQYDAAIAELLNESNSIADVIAGTVHSATSRSNVVSSAR